MSPWLLLVLAIILEVLGTTALKLSEGLTRLWPSLAIFLCYGLAFVALALVLKRIDVSVAYAIWAGLGTAMIAVIGVVFFAEPLGWLKAVSLLLVITGVVGLHLAGGH